MLSPKSKSFLEYANQVANNIKENNHYGNYNKYITLINKLIDYNKGEDLHFDQITPTYLAAFETSLLKLGIGIELKLPECQISSNGIRVGTNMF